MCSSIKAQATRRRPGKIKFYKNAGAEFRDLDSNNSAVIVRRSINYPKCVPRVVHLKRRVVTGNLLALAPRFLPAVCPVQ